MKKRSKTIIICVVLLLVAAAGLGVWALVHYLKTQPSDDGNEVAAAIVDMNDSTPGDYGKIYYAPIDEKHIAEEGSTRFIDNEVLIVVKDGVSEAQVRELAAKYNSEIVGAIEVSGDYQLRLKEAATKEALEGMLQRIEGEEIVENASLDYVIEASATEDEEQHAGFYYGDIWQGDLQNYDDVWGKSWGIEAINTMGAWEELSENKDRVKPVRLGLIDTGFGYNDDLGFAEVFYDRGANGAYSGSKDHGTHVAGIMAAKTNSNVGICGVYPYGDGLLYGVCNGDAQGAFTMNTVVMAEKVAFAELIVRNVKVINSSRGINWKKDKSFVNWYDKTSTDAHFQDHADCAIIIGDFLQRMLDKHYDFVIVSSSGNNSDVLPEKFDCRYSWYLNLISKERYPEVYDRIIVVGALDALLNITNYSDGGPRVDIYAPGGDADMQLTGDILAPGNPFHFAIFSTLPNNDYGYMGGTSMAAPHVAGVAAMVWSANNTLTGSQVKRILLDDANRNPRCAGAHMIDAHQAVSAALRTYDSGKKPEPENGVILCYMVDRFHEEIKIAGANVTLENIDTNELFFEHTDGVGHLEAAVPAGRYKMSVFADGYETYVWPDEDNYPTPIVVENGKANYLDWVKMRRANTTLTVYAYDKETTEPITNRPITITITNPEVGCAEPTQTLSDETGMTTFSIATGKMKKSFEADLRLHIDGYKDFVFEQYYFDETKEAQPELRVLFERPETVPEPVGYINDEGYVVFGHYEQDGNTENGKEPIEWVILDENENGKLLVSRYVLDCVPYNQEYADVTWETCTLRSWLNEDFVRVAFSEDEQTRIRMSQVLNSSIMQNGGNNTEDKVFCLSLEELAKYYKLEYDAYAYFGYNKYLITAATAYAKGRGVWSHTTDGEVEGYYEYAPKGYVESCAGLEGGAWWLRTMGWERDACAVLPYGYAGANYEFGVSTKNYGVRPALWVSNDAIKKADGDGPLHPSDDKEVTFGTYAGEGIVWIVLDETEDSMLLISKYVLDAAQFSRNEKKTTWETCTLREWLNGEFFDQSFNADEKARILTTLVKTPPHPTKGTDGGNDTEDRIFVLSIDEVNRYFPTQNERIAEATEYARQHIYLSNQHGNNASWWLRTMHESDYASTGCVVLYDGRIVGSAVLHKDLDGFRPAMWVSKDAPKKE